MEIIRDQIQVLEAILETNFYLFLDGLKFIGLIHRLDYGLERYDPH